MRDPHRQVAPSLLIFIALDDEAVAFVPLDAKESELVAGRGDRSDVPEPRTPANLVDCGPPSSSWLELKAGSIHCTCSVGFCPIWPMYSFILNYQ